MRVRSLVQPRAQQKVSLSGVTMVFPRASLLAQRRQVTPGFWVSAHHILPSSPRPPAPPLLPAPFLHQGVLGLEGTFETGSLKSLAVQMRTLRLRGQGICPRFSGCVCSMCKATIRQTSGHFLSSRVVFPCPPPLSFSTAFPPGPVEAQPQRQTLSRPTGGLETNACLRSALPSPRTVFHHASPFVFPHRESPPLSWPALF